MPNFKVTVTYTLYNQQWNEIFYLYNATLAGAAALLTPTEVFGLVIPCYKDTALIKIRLSDVANNRSSVVLNYTTLFGQSTAGGPDVTNTTALISLNAPLYGASRKVWMRGLADGDVLRVVGSGTPNPSPALRGGIDVYVDQLITFNFMIRSLQRFADPPVAPLVYTPLGTATALANGNLITFTNTAATQPTVYSMVNLYKVDQKQFPGLKGTFSVVANVPTNPPAPGSFTISWNSPTALLNVPIAGRWRPVLYDYGPIVKLGSGFQGFTSRKTGKNSTGGRGARSAQRLRHAQ